MLKTLRVQLNAPAPELVHQFRNLGEDIRVALKHECEISLAEIDAATSRLLLGGIHSRDLRALANKVRAFVDKSGMGSLVTVSEVTREDEDDENG